MSDDRRDIGGAVPRDARRRQLLIGAAALSAGAALPAWPAQPSRPRCRFGAVVSYATYWNTVQNFRNLLLDTDSEWRDGANGAVWNSLEWNWPRNVAPGKTLVRLIRYHEVEHPGGLPGPVHIRSGKYVIRTRGGWGVNVRTAVGLSDIRSGRDQCTFSIADGLKPFRIEVALENAGQTTLRLDPGDLVICHVDDEAAIRADPHAFMPEMIEHYRGFPMLRNSDISGVAGTPGYTDAGAVPAPMYNGGSWPPELFAKLCKTVGAGMWLNLPHFLDGQDVESFKDTNRFRLTRGDQIVPAPPNGAQMMWTRSGDGRRPSGFDLGPYVVCNRNEQDQTFQLADVATPTVAKRVDANIAVTWQTNMTRLYDWEKQWRVFLQRHHDAYPDCRVVRTEPFLEVWNPGYAGSQFSMSVGAYYRNGSRTGGDRNEGHAFFTFKAWRMIEDVFGKERHIRTLATSLSAWLGSPALDAIDTTGIVEKGAKLGALVRSISPATYYQTLQPAKPAYETVDFFDPKLNVYGGTVFENGEMSRDELVAEWRTKGPFSNARWAEMFVQSFNYEALNLRGWRDRMQTFGRKVGVDYDFVAYESGNHQRRDRPAFSPGRDIDTDIQDSFIAFNFGNSPEIKAFRAQYLKLHEDTGFTLIMYYHGAGAWYRTSVQVAQWGLLPWYGAEQTYPALRGWYDFVKANV